MKSIPKKLIFLRLHLRIPVSKRYDILLILNIQFFCQRRVFFFFFFLTSIFARRYTERGVYEFIYHKQITVIKAEEAKTNVETINEYTQNIFKQM